MSFPVPPPPLDLPSRSTTDPPHPRHNHHIHRPHRSHHHHHQHRDKTVPQSAILPTNSSNPFKSDTSLGDLLSPITKVGNRFEHHHSRGHSGGHNDFGGDGAGGGTGRKGLDDEESLRRREKVREERERSLWKVVERKRGARSEGDEYLQSTLTTLYTLSTSTTRRLDYTHYSLLSHLSSLLSTLSALSTLSFSTTSHLESFNNSTSDVARTTKAQIQQFEDIKFEEQKLRAERLEKRVKGARKRVQMLEGRLKGVEEQVEGVEGAEKERRNRRRWRWKCIWVVGGGIVGIFMLVMMIRRDAGDRQAQLENQTFVEMARRKCDDGGLLGLEEMNATVMMGEVANDNNRKEQETKRVQVRTQDEWEPRLRMLEEL
ncbi:MAG: hypothetical protein Q9166_008191 [cf. Caloplaca sp. 2 TL-2023]